MLYPSPAVDFISIAHRILSMHYNNVFLYRVNTVCRDNCVLFSFVSFRLNNWLRVIRVYDSSEIVKESDPPPDGKAPLYSTIEPIQKV